jgi:hypothetical protein
MGSAALGIGPSSEFLQPCIRVIDIGPGRGGALQESIEVGLGVRGILIQQIDETGSQPLGPHISFDTDFNLTKRVHDVLVGNLPPAHRRPSKVLTPVGPWRPGDPGRAPDPHPAHGKVCNGAFLRGNLAWHRNTAVVVKWQTQGT